MWAPCLFVQRPACSEYTQVQVSCASCRAGGTATLASAGLWKSYALDFYCGPVAPGDARQGSVAKMLPQDVKVIVGWEGAISTFVGLHVDSWLSLDAPQAKEGPQIFGLVKTGEGYGTSDGLLGTELSIDSSKIYINFWYHNMLPETHDFHIGYVVYYSTLQQE